MSKNILLISLYRLGDNIQVTPMLKALKDSNPDSLLWVLAEKGFEMPFQNNPYINQLRLFDREKHTYKDFISTDTLKNNLDPVLMELQEIDFDMLINRQTSQEGAVISGLLNAKEKRGYIALKNKGFEIKDPWTRLLFAMVKQRNMNPFSLVEYNIRIAGGKPEQYKPEIFYNIGDVKNFLDQINIKPYDKIIGIQPGSSAMYRQWNTENFIKLINILLKKYPDIKVILLGSQNEAELLGKIEALIDPSYKNRLVPSWQLPLKSIPALLSRCDLMITNDTGPMHIAEAVGCKILCLYFGGSLINETAPYSQNNLVIQPDMECIPCQETDQCKKSYACKNYITSDMISELAGYMLGNIKTLQQENFKNLKIFKPGQGIYTSGIQYDSVFKTQFTINDLTKILYAVTFREYIANDKIDFVKIANYINNSYLQSDKIINGPIDFDLNAINRYAGSVDEVEQIKKIFLSSFLTIRKSF